MLRRACLLLLLIALLPSTAVSAPPSATSAQGPRTPLSMQVDPAFLPSSLNSTQALWYQRMLGAVNASSTLADNLMLSGDVYTIGREGGNYVEALLMGLRATGDRQFLDRIYDLTQLARTTLRDAWLDGTTDGFTDWLWLADPTNTTYYGKDTDWLDESIVSGNVALWTYAFQVNRSVDPKFAAAADFWRGWLETQFLAKWYQRAGGDSLGAWDTPFLAFYKPDVEPRSANWRLAWFLWKLGGDDFYRARKDEILTQLSLAQVPNPLHPEAYDWAQTLDPTTLLWQPVNYANYYARVTIEMNLEGQPFYSSPSTMERFAATFRDVVYAGSLPGLTSMTSNVNGDGSIGYALYAFNGFAAWDSSGVLAALAERSITPAGNYAGGGLSKAARNDVYISAYALAALAIQQAPTTAAPAPTAPARLLAVAGAPNPFSSSTRIAFTLPRSLRVRLSIVDAGGREVRVLEDGDLAAGRYTRAWDGRDRGGVTMAPGVYLAIVQAGTERAIARITRLR